MEKKVIRSSNIELLRIIGMLMILAHHFVVNSGIQEAFVFGDTSSNYIYLSFMNMWGPTGLNLTVLISGYFMCKSHLTVKRYCKILFEYIFYTWGIYLILLVAGRETIGLRRLFKLFFGLFRDANVGFIGSFMIIYLFIPYINLLIQKITKKDFLELLLLLLFVFSGIATFFDNKEMYGGISWYFILYLVGAYLRMYPPVWSTNLKASLRFFIVSIILAYASVIFMIVLASVIHNGSPQYFLYHCNKLGTLLLTISMFCTFKNINISYSKTINLIAKTAFGVLMIHNSSAAMRQLLWRDLLHVDSMSGIPTVSLILNSIVICVGIYIVCSLIDMVRIFTVERWVFDHFEVIEHYIRLVWKTIKNAASKCYTKVIECLER